jgi:hypothetical protein
MPYRIFFAMHKTVEEIFQTNEEVCALGLLMNNGLWLV